MVRRNNDTAIGESFQGEPWGADRRDLVRQSTAVASSLHIRLNGKPVAESGSRTITPSSPTIITILVSGTHLGVFGQTSQSVPVGVDYPSRVVIDPSTPNPVAVLIGALNSPNPKQTVELCDVDLDLTGCKWIVIRDNRSLIGRVGQGITTSPSHRTVRDSLPSYGSYQSFKFRKMFVPSTSV